MRNYLAGALLAGLVLVPVAAGAAQFTAGEEYSSGANDRVTGGLYVAGGNISSGGRIDGDLWAAGGDITVTGPVNGDAMLGGGSVQLLAPVQGDVRVGAGQFSTDDRISGDLVVLGGTVRVLADAVVDGGLYVLGGSVVLDGTVRGPVQVTGGRLTINGSALGPVTARLDDALVIGPDAQLTDGLSYKAPSEAGIPETARVTGAVEYSRSMETHGGDEAAKAALWSVLAVVTAMKTLALLGLALLLVWRWRRPALEVLQDAHDRFWPSLGHGFIYAILVPIGAFLLAISIVGTMAGGILLAVYGILLMLAKAMAGLLVGAWLWKKLRKGDPAMQPNVLHLEWAPSIVGVVLLELIGLIPVVGFLLRTAIWLAIFGALGQRTHRALS